MTLEVRQLVKEFGRHTAVSGVDLDVALAQVAPVTGDPDATFAKFTREVRSLRALSPALGLVVFPELYLSGLGSFDAVQPAGYLDRLAEPVPGPRTDAVCELAVETGLWIVPGSLPERSALGVHNTAVAVSPQGDLVASYRKIFPWMPYETSVPGDTYVTFDIPEVGRLGLAICYDGWVPEIIRTLAWMGAEVIVQPTYTRTSDREQELVLARANAIANQAYVLNPNIGGLFGTGRSIAADPEGRVLAQGGAGEEFHIVHLDLELVSTVREHGTAGLNPVWKQLRDVPPPFPPVEQGYAKGEVMRGLGAFPAPAAGSAGA